MLILSCFPGIVSGQPELTRCCHTTCQHRVVGGTENPHVLLLAVARTYWHTVASGLVMDVNYARFPANLALTQGIGAALKEAGDSGGPATVVDELHSPPVLGIPLVESVASSAMRFLRALRRAVLAPPVILVSTRKVLSTNTAGPFSIGGFPMMESEVPLMLQKTCLADMRAESLLLVPGRENSFASIAGSVGIGESHCLEMGRIGSTWSWFAKCMRVSIGVPVSGFAGNRCHRQPATAGAQWRILNLLGHQNSLSYTGSAQ